MVVGRIERPGARSLAEIIIVAGLVTPYLTGAIGAYVQLGCALLVVTVLVATRAGIAFAGDLGSKLFLVAVLALAVAFALDAHQPRDVAYALNFAPLLLFGPLSRFFAAFAGVYSINRVARYALLGALLAAAVAALQVFALNQGRAEGWGSDPIWSSAAALVVGFLAVLGLGSSRSRYRFFYVLGPIAGIAVCLLSGSRGSLLAVPVLLLVTTLFSSHRWQILGGALLACLLFWTGVVLFWPAGLARLASFATLWQQMSSGRSITEASAGTRQAFYLAGYQAFLHAPWVGYGWVDKMTAIVPYLPGDGAALVAPHRHLHSDILDFGVSGGILGLVAYGLIMAAPIVAALRSPRDSQFHLRVMGAALLVAGYAICGLTYLLFGYEYLTTLFAVLASVLVGYCRDAPILLRR